MIRLERTNVKNVWDILKLRVSDAQKSFVAPNDVSIIEAYIAITHHGQAFPFGIYDDEGKLEENFQDFHRYPEISTKEFRTTKKIKEYLTEWGVKLIALPLPTGVLAQIGTGNRPVAALRCDLDALPVQEETGLHACLRP